ncbi:MAG: sigma-E factor negative regulatory protein [Gammaproteobacteria bacterium]|jgi:sigma-E factor negative regulatory protein RseA|nr:sigma-E factor negative regulatory protein [Gammaproteobacteria bacterium]
MTKQIDEQVSVFMDGELHGSEHSAVIERICRDDELRDRWQRYHLISDTLGNNLPAAIDNQFATSVMEALKNEPTVFAPAALKHKSTVKQKITGAAIAASVAAVAVIGVQTINQPKETATSLAEMPSTDQYVRMEQLANSTPVNSTPKAFIMAPTVPALKASSSDTQDAKVTQIYQYHPQLNKYLLNHNQHTMDSRVQGVMPYARIVVSPSRASTKDTNQQGQ